MSLPSVTVAICTYKRYDLLPAAIESVLKQDYDRAAFELLVIDNNPPSDARTAFAARYEQTPGLRYITVDTPGLSNARNVALEMSKARYIAFLDDDAVATSGWLSALAETFAASGDTAGAVGGRTLPGFAEARPPWLHDRLLAYLSVVDWPATAARALDPTREHIVGANIAFDRALLAELGGFDTKFGRQGTGNLLSGEEDGVMRAILRRGRALWYSPAAEVTHYIPQDRLTRAWFRRRAAWQAVTTQMQRTLPQQQVVEAWELALGYFKQFNNGEHFLNLYVDTDSPDLFLLQVNAVKWLTSLTLAEGKFPYELK